MRHAPILALVLLATVGGRAAAAPTVMVETDPSTFALGGFAAHARVAPRQSHWIGGLGAYALDLPQVLVGLDAANRDQGWHVRLQLGAAAFVDYAFAGEARGWFVGVEAALQRYRYTRDAMPGAATALDAVVMPRAGYRWQPWTSGFYVLPWLGVGYQGQLTGARTVADRTYRLGHVVPYAAVHVGWAW